MNPKLKSKYSNVVEGKCPNCTFYQEFTRDHRSGELVKCPKCNSNFRIEDVLVGKTYDGYSWEDFDRSEVIIAQVQDQKSNASTKLSFGLKFWVFLFFSVIIGNIFDVILITLLGGTYTYSNPSVLFIASIAILFQLVICSNQPINKKILHLVLGFIGVKLLFYIISFLVVIFLY